MSIDLKYKVVVRDAVEVMRQGKAKGESKYQELYDALTQMDVNKGIAFSSMDKKQRQTILSGLNKCAERDPEKPKAKSATIVGGGILMWLEYSKARDVVKSAKKDVKSVTDRYGKLSFDSKD